MACARLSRRAFVKVHAREKIGSVGYFIYDRLLLLLWLSYVARAATRHEPAQVVGGQVILVIGAERGSARGRGRVVAAVVERQTV